jgi:hypothetical protein
LTDVRIDIIAGYNPGANSVARKLVKFNDFAEAICQLGLCRLTLDQDAPSGFRRR